MNTASKKTSFIKVRIETFTSESERIPKFVELFNDSIKLVWSQWYESNSFSIDNIEAGTYTLRLSLSSGVQKEETFDLNEDEVKEIHFSIANNSPHESHEWAYLAKSFTIDSVRDTNMKQIDYYKEQGINVSARFWSFTDGRWDTDGNIFLSDQMIYRDGLPFTVETESKLKILEISGAGMQNLYVCLPPANSVKCLIKLSDYTSEDAHPIDVTLSTDNYKAETLLTLLTTGAIREAKTLSNATDAENLLMQKMINPVTAAIGGYFLLKTDELDRLHDWAYNLATWFEWLPDGSIIHATQLLSKKVKSASDIEMIRMRLLHASNNGLPVYSEGLRLLEKGLTQLWYHFNKSDLEINDALSRVEDYMRANDFRQETTTFIGISPEEPNKDPLLVSEAPQESQPHSGRFGNRHLGNAYSENYS